MRQPSLNFGRTLSLIALLAVAPAALRAQTVYTEDFNAPGDAWESGWFGVNSDYVNGYCMSRGCTDRGNAPTAVWYEGSPIHFLNGFGSSITSMSIGLGSFIDDSHLLVYDAAGTLFYDALVPYSGSYSDGLPFLITTSNGISRFELTSNAYGNVTMDNIVVTAGVTAAPEPATLVLLASGLVAMAGVTRRRRSIR